MPSYMAELGHIYLGLGFASRAKAVFEKSIKFDPTNKRAAAGLERVSAMSASSSSNFYK